jgi:hypothetical protein
MSSRAFCPGCFPIREMVALPRGTTRPHIVPCPVPEIRDCRRYATVPGKRSTAAVVLRRVTVCVNITAAGLTMWIFVRSFSSGP